MQAAHYSPLLLHSIYRTQAQPDVTQHAKALTFKERRELAKKRTLNRVYDGAHNQVFCIILMLSAYAVGFLSNVFPPLSLLLGVLMRSSDSDVRASACHAVRFVRWPTAFTVRAVEDCLFDPASIVTHAVMRTLPALGPKYVSVDACIVLVMKRRSDSEEIAERLAEHYKLRSTSQAMEDLDMILQILSQLQADDPFLGTLISRLVTTANSDAWQSVQLLYSYVENQSELGAESAGQRGISNRRMHAIQGLRTAVRVFLTADGFKEEFEQLRNDLSLMLIGESDTAISSELDRLLQDIDLILES